MKNQIGKRNLSDFERIEMALILEPELKKKAKENQKLSEGAGKKGMSISTNLNARNEVAKAAGVGSEKLYRAKKVLEHAPKEVVDKVRAGTPWKFSTGWQCSHSPVIAKKIWWLGDLLAFGEATYGELLGNSDENLFTPQTLREAKYVSKSVPASRRLDGLSWTHHQAVASLPEQQHKKLLKQAADEGLSVAKFRGAVKQIENSTTFIP